MSNNYLPNQWTAVGVTRGFEPCPADKLNILIVAKYGEGKTTFIMSRPDTLCLSFEDSAHFVPSPRAARLTIRSWQDWASIRNLLEQEQKKPTFKCVAFDTIDDFVDVIDRELALRYTTEKRKLVTITEYGDGGAGYSIIKNAVRRELDTLSRWGYARMATSHIVEKSARIGGVDTLIERISVFPSIRDILVGKVEYCLALEKQTVSESIKVPRELKLGGDKTKTIVDVKMESRDIVVLTSKCGPGIPVKSRVTLPPSLEVPPPDGWQVLADAYNKACEEKKQLEKETKEKCNVPSL